MASKSQIKEAIKGYITKNYVLENRDQEMESASITGIKKLLDSTQQRLSTLLRDITQPETKLQIVDDVVDYILNGFNTMADLPDATLRNHFIDKFGGGEEMDNGMEAPEPEPEETVDEMSTSGAAGAYNTKYAFRRKK